jgi:hypothetical protein
MTTGISRRRRSAPFPAPVGALPPDLVPAPGAGTRKKKRKDRNRRGGRGDNKRKAEKEAGEVHSDGERKKIKTGNGNRDDLSEDEEDRETREQKEHILISFTDLDHLKKCLESWTGQRLEDEAEGPKLTDSCDLVSRILEENGIKG